MLIPLATCVLSTLTFSKLNFHGLSHYNKIVSHQLPMRECMRVGSLSYYLIIISHNLLSCVVYLINVQKRCLLIL